MINSNLKKDIDTVIKQITKGTIFDAHYVIQQLIFNHSTHYQENRSKYHHVNTFHSDISKEIKKICGPYLSSDSISINIHLNSSLNKCWRK